MPVPKLRFKDENGQFYPELNRKSLHEIAAYRRGSFPQPYGNPEWYDEKFGMPFVQVADIDENMQLKCDTQRHISTLAQKDSVFVPKGTLLVTLQGSIGKVAITNYDSFVDRTLLIFTKLNSTVIKDYLKYTIFLLFANEKRHADGGIIKTITKYTLNNFKVYLPSLPEQEKIADFLSTYDYMIDVQSQRVEAMKTRKKGLLQKIFSQKIKFKDDQGQNYPEWEYKRLGEFFTKIKQKNTANLIDNVITNSAALGLIQQQSFFDKDIANKANTDKYYVIKKGDFVYNPRISNEAPFGPIHIYLGEQEGIVSPLYLCFTPIHKDISLSFMKYYFKSSRWHKYIYANGDTGARDDRVSIKTDTFFKMPIFVPSLPEQEKIADFLTAVDAQIEVEEKRLETMKTIKKGLLQQMFI